ncbi:MAG: hypothetical protein Q8919_08440 [Bacteroidota bacterium]|nr:hypothetical protein [Bacteroidota bacterium]
MTAAETLKKENYLNAKRDTYIEALDLMYRKLSTLQFHFGDVPSLKPYQRNTGSKPWTELEVNRCLSKLYVYSADPEIPAILESVFGSGNTHAISSLVDFIARIRRDLGDTGQIISHEKFHYIEIPSDSMYSHDSTIQRLLTY